MKKSPMVLICLLLLALKVNLLAQMPPHPELLRKIKNNEIEMPEAMKNMEALRLKGIDQPWSERSAGGLMKASGNDSEKVFGPDAGPEGKYNALVVLVDFPDKPFSTDPKYFDNLLFSDGTGTLKNYLKDVSYGKLELANPTLPSKIGVVRAPQNYSYYVGTNNGMGAYPNNTQRLVEDILPKIDSIVNFTEYDNNKNSFVDALFIVHSGTGAELTGSKSDIWSHAWITRSSIKKDAAYIAKYSVEPEFWYTPGDMTMGVYAHEMGHAAFGLPDLYDYGKDKDASEGLGDWSLMAGGSWNGNNGNSPAYPDAWSRIQMGYLTPVNITSDSLNLPLPAIKDTAVAYKVWRNGNPGKEYFLIENRQSKGFDSRLPGNGMLIYHVDETRPNNDYQWYPGYTSNSHYRVALEQADGLWDLERDVNQGDLGDPFPGRTGNKVFSANSIPDNRDYLNGFTNFKITGVTPSSSKMFFNISMNDVLNPSVTNADFGDVRAGVKSDTISVNILNSGLKALSVKSWKIFGKNFQVLNMPPTPLTLEANKSIMAKIVFLPDAQNMFLDSLEIEYALTQSYKKYVRLKGQGFQLVRTQENVLYAATGKSAEASLGSINMENAKGLIIGVTGFNEARSVAVSRKESILYALCADLYDNYLSVVNPETGKAYKIGKLKKPLRSIAFDNNDELYGISPIGGIYKINLATAQIDSITTAKLKVNGAAFDPVTNSLYLSTGSGAALKDAIYTANKSTGDTLLIGVTGLNSYTNALAFNKNGELYGVIGSQLQANSLIKINKSNAAAVVLGTTGIKGLTGLTFGTEMTTEVAEDKSVRISDFSLSQNYPNPFNPVTSIEFSLPEKCVASLKIYDILGRQAAVLLDEETLAGSHKLEFNANSLSSGVYFYRLTAGKLTLTRKLVLLK